MIRWLLYLLPGTVVTVLCYLTNFIVVLFCDEEGELPSFLHYWQTWDDSCDSEYYMKNCVPSFLDYGYDEHYTSHCDTDEWTAPYNETRMFSIYRPGCTWTTWQRIQRYFCRLLWLTRNCAYGFRFFIFGADVDNVRWKIDEPDEYFGIGDNCFMYKNQKPICSWLRWKVYIGWKQHPGGTESQHCMYTDRILIKMGV